MFSHLVSFNFLGEFGLIIQQNLVRAYCLTLNPKLFKQYKSENEMEKGELDANYHCKVSGFRLFTNEMSQPVYNK